MGWLLEKTRSTASASCGVPKAAPTDEKRAWCSGRYLAKARTMSHTFQTKIPEFQKELAALHEGLRQLQIGFLGEALHRTHRGVGRDLDVTVARFGRVGRMPTVISASCSATKPRHSPMIVRNTGSSTTQ